MGFTRYWYVKAAPELADAYRMALRDIRQLISTCADGLGGEFGIPDEFSVTNGVSFNGRFPHYLESFGLPEELDDLKYASYHYQAPFLSPRQIAWGKEYARLNPEPTTRDGYTFHCCKTGSPNQPYDAVVVAALIILKGYLGDNIIVTTDADNRDFSRESGLRLAHQVSTIPLADPFLDDRQLFDSAINERQGVVKPSFDVLMKSCQFCHAKIAEDATVCCNCQFPPLTSQDGLSEAVCKETSMTIRGMISGGMLQGVWAQVDQAGVTRSEMTFKNGACLKWRRFYASGQLKFEDIYGAHDAIITQVYWPNGNLLSESYSDQDKIVEKSWYEAGQMASIATRSRDGYSQEERSYYEDGHLQVERVKVDRRWIKMKMWVLQPNGTYYSPGE